MAGFCPPAATCTAAARAGWRTRNVLTSKWKFVWHRTRRECRLAVLVTLRSCPLEAMTPSVEIALDPAAERRRRADRRNGSGAASTASSVLPAAAALALFGGTERRNIILDRRDAINTVEQALAELARMEAACRIADDASTRAEAA